MSLHVLPRHFLNAAFLLAVPFRLNVTPQIKHFVIFSKKNTYFIIKITIKIKL